MAEEPTEIVKRAIGHIGRLYGAHDPEALQLLGGDVLNSIGVARGQAHGVHTAMVRLRQAKPHLFRTAAQMTPAERAAALREFELEPAREAERQSLARDYARLGIKTV